jgi:hypothetical protein
MSNKKDVRMKVGREEVVFSPEKTAVNIYRRHPEMNNIEVDEESAKNLYQNNRRIIFGQARAVIFFSGIAMPTPELHSEDAQALAGDMLNDYGWNAPVNIVDEAPEIIKSRFGAFLVEREKRLNITVARLSREIDFMPEEWYVGENGLSTPVTPQLSESEIDEQVRVFSREIISMNTFGEQPANRQNS